ncbi:mitochondrial putative cytochrome c peroxidase [Gigaspora margarita]|uniref:Mitochondrial putative cytochrome c peroxidase n=1 Tax=Gigaspora margarita TaxID=4874 RepID=A0A8H3WXW4_GIGMA|nr:mitochondrial putative cytochrome c peroxidase [Gigaspora margarita]
MSVIPVKSIGPIEARRILLQNFPLLSTKPTKGFETYAILTKQEWHEKKLDNGLLQYADKKDRIMMFPADMAFLNDPQFKEIVQIYAQDKQQFFKDFAEAFGKLLELGVNREEVR